MTITPTQADRDLLDQLDYFEWLHADGRPNTDALHLIALHAQRAREQALDEAAGVAESESAMAVFRGETCSEDMVAEYGFEADYAAFIAASIRALKEGRGDE